MAWPLTIAHRAGNDLDRLRAAEAIGVDFVEADVWLHRGQLEIRHEKTAVLLPILWDRWSLAPGWLKRLSLSDLLEASQPDTHLLLDLKGINRRLPTMVKRILHATREQRRIAVCSQNWTFVDAFREQPEILRVYSIGSVRQLQAWANRHDGRDPIAISINARLLDVATVEVLRGQAEVIAPWGVRSREQARQLLAMGATAINADDLDLLSEIIANRELDQGAKPDSVTYDDDASRITSASTVAPRRTSSGSSPP
jgi:glycerophosphoryl diester phosphodiesterase